MINANTKLFCIIGNPIRHSLSPQIHNAGYKKLALNNIFVAFETSDLKSALFALKSLGVSGIAITVPYKQKVLNYCDTQDASVKKIGAANTIINIKGKLHALNTDWLGAQRALLKSTTLAGKNVIIRGAGGASRAICYSLKKENAKVKIINRSILNAQKLVAEFSLDGVVEENNIAEIRKADILINASSLGMNKSDLLPFPLKSIQKSQLIFDIVYSPKNTQLIKTALLKKAVVIYGYKMLLYQASEQFKLFTGKNISIGILENSLLKYLN